MYAFDRLLVALDGWRESARRQGWGDRRRVGVTREMSGVEPDARAVFAAAMRSLRARTPDVSDETIARRASATASPSGRRVRVDPRRMGEWVAGRSVPRSFEPIAALVRSLQPDPGVEQALIAWRELWRAAAQSTRRPVSAEPGVLAAPDRIDDAGRGLAEHRPTTVPPRQLPSNVSTFSGRRDALTQLDRVRERTDGSSGSTPIVVLSGMAGAGKTSLAVHWAHQVAGHFPDGQLYVNLRGFDPADSAMASAEAVRAFLDALGVAPARIPDHLTPQVGLYRSLLAGRRLLLVLDNAATVDQVRPLLPGAPGCLVVVTSRYRLPGLVAGNGAEVVTLAELNADEAGQLLTARLGGARVAAEPGSLEGIVAACGGLPLALAIVAARAITNPQLPLAALAEELSRLALSGTHGADHRMGQAGSAEVVA